MTTELMANSLAVGFGALFVAVVGGLSAAVTAATVGRRLQRFCLGAGGLALALPPFLPANSWLEWTAAWRSALGPEASARALLPLTALVLGLGLWPITLFFVLGAWRRLQTSHLEAEPALRRGALFRWLLWPAARTALLQAMVLTLTLALANFTIPTLFQVRVFTEEFWIRYNTQFDLRGALIATWPLWILPVALGWIFRGQDVSWPRTQRGLPPALLRARIGVDRWWAHGVTLLFVGVGLAIPLGRLFGTVRTWTELPGALAAGSGAAAHSFFAAIGTAIAVTVVAYLALPRNFSRPGQLVRGDARTTAVRRLGGARVSASDVLRVAVELVSDRWRRPMARWRSALNGGLWLVFLLPGVFLGVALIGLLNRPGLTWLYAGFGVVFLALGLRYFAPVQSAVVAALQASDRELYEAADLAGAGAWTRFQWVTWPQSGGSLLAVGYAVYLLCLWDVETLVLIQPPGGETLALRIFNLLHYGHAAQVNALCIVLLGIALAPLIAYGIIERLSRRWISSKNTAGAGVLALGLGLGLVGCTPPTDIAEVHELESKIFSGVQTIGSRGVAPGQFNKPRSLICDRADNLYVTDMTGRIQKFSADGRFLLQWQMPQTEIGKPKGMTLDPVGNIVVVEPHYQRVNHFTPEGKLVAQWGRRGAQPGEFILPRCVAINSMGEYYLGEYTTVERIQKFTLPEVPGPVAGLKSATGWPATLAVTWGQPGQGPGDLNRAEGIAVGPGDRVYVADSCNHRIQVFDSGGKFIREHGRAGSHPGELSYPYDVRVERSGRQFVCEFGNSRISIFDASDRLIETIGKAGVGAGQFANPWAICLDSKGNLYVADSQNHRVQKLLRRAAGKGTLAFTGVDSIGVGAPHSADTFAGTVSWFH